VSTGYISEESDPENEEGIGAREDEERQVKVEVKVKASKAVFAVVNNNFQWADPWTTSWRRDSLRL